VDPLYRSPVLAARREVSSLALCSEDGEATSVCVEGRRVELQARLFHGGASRQWRVYLGSSQSLLVMELWSTCGWRRLASGDGRRQWNLEDLGCRGSKDWLVISLFFRDLCAFSSKQMSSVSFINVSVFVRVPVWYP
jgi:hypothetical protein